MAGKAFKVRELFAVGLLIVLMAVGMRFARSIASGGRHQKQLSVSVQPVLLAEEEAYAGKVITVSGHGSTLATITCKPYDAAVAVVSMPTPRGESELLPMVDQATDGDGRSYIADIATQESFLFVTIERGFAHTPKQVTVKIHFFAPRDSKRQAVAQISIPFTKIAPAKRLLSPPTGKNLVEAEKYATAEYIENKKFLAIKPKPGLAAYASTMAYSFSPPEALKDGMWVSNPTYTGDQDAVMVRLDYPRAIDTQFSLTYKNAEIAKLNGVNVLQLPSDQTVGTIQGQTATIQKFDWSKKVKSLKRSHGDVLIKVKRLAPHLAGRIFMMGNSMSVPSLTLLRVTPPVSDLGLDWLQVSIDAYLFHTRIDAATKNNEPLTSKIPELKIDFRLQRIEFPRSQTIVLPIHRVKSDPALFPEIHPPSPGPGLRLRP